MKELFYIKGDPTNPEGVKEALLEKYPYIDRTSTCDLDYVYYFVNENSFSECGIYSFMGNLLKTYGTEIFPKKKQEFEEKTMYKPLYHCNMFCTTEALFNTIEEVLNSSDNVIGYQEVKVKVLKK